MKAKTIRYTLVHPEGSAHYVAPRAPACPAAERYLAAHREDGGGWGIVDRHTGRLLTGARPDEHRYPSWGDASAAAGALNGPPAGFLPRRAG